MAYIPNDTGSSVSTYIKMRISYSYTETSTGHSVTATLQLRRTNSYSGTTFQYPSSSTLSINGVSQTWNWTSDNYPRIPGNNTNWIDFCSKTVNVTHTAATTITISGSNNNMGSYLTGSVSGTAELPAIISPPDTPTVSPVASSASLINITWGTTSLGNPAGTVSLYEGMTNNPTTLMYSKSTTGTSVFGRDQRTANTEYFYKAVASNSEGTVSSTVESAITYPAGITNISTTTTATTATHQVTCAPSGNALTTTLQKSHNNNNWVDVATDVQGTTVTVTETGLTPDHLYTIYFRVVTSAGASASLSKAYSTKKVSNFYGSVNDEAVRIAKMYGSVGGDAKRITKIYGSEGGVAKLIFQD